ncbi:MAG: alpha/beta fold hydrolase [Thermoleophilaceae bacterium]
MKALVAALAGVAGLLALPAASSAAISFCGPSDRPCARLLVPLDRSRQVPGDVSLALERDRAAKPFDPPLFLLADGPGQSAIGAFDPETVDFLVGLVARRRDIVVLDQRGTGDSGPLRCGRLRRARAHERPAAAARCALRLGPGRAFYSTQDSVDDLEAVRAALGYPRLALLGIGNGGKLALAYAARHPGRVERLVLGSPVGPGGPDPFGVQGIRALPRALSALCRRRCGRFTRSPARDLRRLVRRMNRRVLRGYVIDRRGRRHRARLSSSALLRLLQERELLSADILYELPGLARSALRGDAAPMLRLVARLHSIEAVSHMFGPEGSSPLAFAAGRCQDGPFPWRPDSPVDGRYGSASSVARALPPSAFRPFRREALLGASDLRLCMAWPPSPSRGLPGGTLPDVPALVISGEEDLTTPVASGRRVARLFPQGRQLVVPDAGHEATAYDLTGCSADALQRFLQRRRVPRACPRLRVAGLIPPPAPLSLRRLRPLGGVRGMAGRALRALRLTVDDAVRSASTDVAPFIGLLDDSIPDLNFVQRAGGLRGGTVALRPIAERLRLRRYVYVPGMRVTGWARHLNSKRRLRARFVVSGRGAPDGKVLVHGRTVTGSLGGQPIWARLSLQDVALLARSSSRHAALLRR